MQHQNKYNNILKITFLRNRIPAIKGTFYVQRTNVKWFVSTHVQLHIAAM